MYFSLIVVACLAGLSAAFPTPEKAVSIVSRAAWGARAPTSTSSLTKPLSYIFIHHSEGPEANTLAAGKSTVKGIQNYHMDSNGWADIGYSFLIGGDGSIFEGRGWNNVGAHTSGYNSVGYGICFLGSFTNKNPTAAAINSGKALIADAVAKGYVKKTYKLKGHRQMGSTDCPGNTFFNLIKSWANFSA